MWEFGSGIEEKEKIWIKGTVLNLRSLLGIGKMNKKQNTQARKMFGMESGVNENVL